MQVASLNMRMNFGGGKVLDQRLANLLAAHTPDIVLLQECSRRALDAVCGTCDLEGVHAHYVEPARPRGTFSPDGTAIAVRSPFRIEDAWRLMPETFRPEIVDASVGQEPPFAPQPEMHEQALNRLMDRYSGRALLARISQGATSFLAGSFHATPGSGRVWGMKVGQAKPYFHAGLAIALSELDDPFLFGLDANESDKHPLDKDYVPSDGWGIRVATLIGRRPLHRARDLLIESVDTRRITPHSETTLAVTYDTGAPDGRLRYDSLWATPEFTLDSFDLDYEGVLAAEGDHALLTAELHL